MGQFGAVVGPDTLAPGAVAAGLGGQQLEPRPAVAGVGRDPGPGSAGGPASWPSMGSALVVATDPGQLTGPAATPLVWRWLSYQPRLVEEVGQPVGAVAGASCCQRGCWSSGWDHRQLARLGAAGHQLLQVLGEVPHRPLGARAVVDDPEGAGENWCIIPRFWPSAIW